VCPKTSSQVEKPALLVKQFTLTQTRSVPPKLSYAFQKKWSRSRGKIHLIATKDITPKLYFAKKKGHEIKPKRQLNTSLNKSKKNTVQGKRKKDKGKKGSCKQICL